MTMLLLTTPRAFDNFWLRRRLQSQDNPPTHQILLRVNCSLPQTQGVIKGTRFEGVDAIESAVTTELKRLSNESFQHCIGVWQRRMEACIRLQGDYFKGDIV